MVFTMDVMVDKKGLFVIPKKTREKYGITLNSRLLIRENKGSITLIPVNKHTNSVLSLYGSINISPSINDPKNVARQHTKKLTLTKIF